MSQYPVPSSPNRLEPCRDASAAEWISGSVLPWSQLVSFGPEGFPSHARLRFIPDPDGAGQEEHESGADVELASEAERLGIAVSILREHTTTPDQLYYAFWDGYGMPMTAARFGVPNREYFLYRGSCRSPDQHGMPDPAFIWPADHSWCIANDVDPHWAGISASAAAIKVLLADERLDVAAAVPTEQQPYYY